MALDPASGFTRDFIPSPIQGRVGALLCALATLVLLSAAVIHGQGARASAERSSAIAIEEENRTFCASLGLIQTTEVYQRCADGLTDIRRRHEERLNLELSML
jgi:hypothetical protein